MFLCLSIILLWRCVSICLDFMLDFFRMFKVLLIFVNMLSRIRIINFF